MKTFKVEARRSDKRFPYKSPEICAELGGGILDKCKERVFVKADELKISQVIYNLVNNAINLSLIHIYSYRIFSKIAGLGSAHKNLPI